jgi:ATP-dependent DNA helicase RecG
MIPFPSHPVLAAGVKSLNGVGAQIEKALKARGWHTVGDLLTLMPVRYQDRRGLTPLGELTAEAEVLAGGMIGKAQAGIFPKNKRRYFEITIHDDTGRLSRSGSVSRPTCAKR